MENNDLRSMWRDVHSSNLEITYDKKSFAEILKMNHCKSIAKVLSGIRLKIMAYAAGLLVFTGLMIYAFVYLQLKLHLLSIIPMALAGLFFFIKITIEINSLILLNKTSDNESLKNSLLLFRNGIARMKKIDFLSYLIYFYLLVIVIVYNYINDAGEYNLFRNNAILPFLFIPVLLLLIVPWIIKFQQNREYKKIYSNLDKSVEFFNDEKNE
jgi:hypothetical protein